MGFRPEGSLLPAAWSPRYCMDHRAMNVAFGFAEYEKIPSTFFGEITLHGIRVRCLSSAQAATHWESEHPGRKAGRVSHRVHAECPRCFRWVSYTRLDQHVDSWRCRLRQLQARARRESEAHYAECGRCGD